MKKLILTITILIITLSAAQAGSEFNSFDKDTWPTDYKHYVYELSSDADPMAKNNDLTSNAGTYELFIINWCIDNPQIKKNICLDMPTAVWGFNGAYSEIDKYSYDYLAATQDAIYKNQWLPKRQAKIAKIRAQRAQAEVDKRAKNKAAAEYNQDLQNKSKVAKRKADKAAMATSWRWTFAIITLAGLLVWLRSKHVAKKQAEETLRDLRTEERRVKAEAVKAEADRKAAVKAEQDRINQEAIELAWDLRRKAENMVAAEKQAVIDRQAAYEAKLQQDIIDEDLRQERLAEAAKESEVLQAQLEVQRMAKEVRVNAENEDRRIRQELHEIERQEQAELYRLKKEQEDAEHLRNLENFNADLSFSNIAPSLDTDFNEPSGHVDRNAPHLVYYVRIDSACGNTVYKIGITGKSIKGRFSGNGHATITPIKTWIKANEADARKHEAFVMRTYRDQKYQGPAILHNGNTEMFNSDILGLDTASES